ncbi:PIG-L family deacetylase [Chitinispirillales bacterium ANBcel5]|uniref:PIG-L deacetylase family protein n=1 Tax=Cellulosispirillum alkaliphilum TaxID=3039283 RepID=UPI002A4FAD45|nr:PIG-L family deacetylase [Chitinispirillales bacterium ANBcel5]
MIDSFLEKLCYKPNNVNRRTLIVAAHPDDDVISMGSRLRYLKDVKIVYITDGAPNIEHSNLAGCYSREQYARKRRRESEQALDCAGLSKDCCIWLDITDQTASFRMVEIIKKLVDIIKYNGIEKIITHTYEGGHPDHDTASFVVWSACRMLKEVNTDVYEFSSYFNHDCSIKTNYFLNNLTKSISSNISNNDLEIKHEMVSCYKTQVEMIKHFDITKEIFRKAPTYNYLNNPHSGILFYELMEWGITGREWRQAASESMHMLGLKRKS